MKKIIARSSLFVLGIASLVFLVCGVLSGNEGAKFLAVLVGSLGAIFYLIWCVRHS